MSSYALWSCPDLPGSPFFWDFFFGSEFIYKIAYILKTVCCKCKTIYSKCGNIQHSMCILLLLIYVYTIYNICIYNIWYTYSILYRSYNLYSFVVNRINPFRFMWNSQLIPEWFGPHLQGHVARVHGVHGIGCQVAYSSQSLHGEFRLASR